MVITDTSVQILLDQRQEQGFTVPSPAVTEQLARLLFPTTTAATTSVNHDNDTLH